MLKISILTICPAYFESFLSSHVVERADGLGLAGVEIIDIREFAGGSFRHVDDSPYGGGRGMILRAQPILDAVKAIKKRAENEGGHEPRTLLLSPKGSRYDQKTAWKLSREEHLIFICGHYEGVDARVETVADEMLSLGDFVLSGGEPAACAIADSILRLLPGNLREGSTGEESFEDGMLEYPQYTRPETVEGMRVPEVLLSGNHEAIASWRRQQALDLTNKLRPDMLEASPVSLL